MMPIGRKDDIQLTVVQDNDTRQLLIEEVVGSDALVQDLLRCPKSLILGRDLRDFLPQRIQELIDDYIEFSLEGNDLLSVLKRTPHFSLRNKEGAEVDVNMRIQYGVMGENPRFILLASDKMAGLKMCLDTLLEFPQMLDPELKVDNRASMEGKMRIVQDFVNADEIKASMALIYSQDSSPETLKQLTDALKQTLRQHDIVGYMEQGLIAICFLKLPAEELQTPLDRVRKKLAESLPNKTTRVVAQAFVGNKDATASLGFLRSQLNQLDEGEAKIFLEN